MYLQESSLPDQNPASYFGLQFTPEQGQSKKQGRHTGLQQKIPKTDKKMGRYTCIGTEEVSPHSFSHEGN